jgi:hypothetical protein
MFLFQSVAKTLIEGGDQASVKNAQTTDSSYSQALVFTSYFPPKNALYVGWVRWITA